MWQDPDSARSGHNYYVPDVRIAKLGQLRSGPEGGDILQDLRGDILRVEVTRVASGLSQYSITLNNSFHSLPRERGGEALTGPAPREQKLLFPRFKYNHFDVLGFGQRLRIDMRYWPDPVQRISDPQGTDKGWIPMIAGPITDMKFTFAAGEGARVEITGTDDLHALTNKTKEREQFNKRGELEIIRALFEKAQYPLPVAKAQVTRPEFMSGGQGISEAVEARQSYFDFIKKIADKYDLEVFIEFAPTSGDPALEFHFEPSRSRLPPDKTLREIYVLERDKHLVDFTPTIRLGDQFTSASIRGSHRIPTRDGIIKKAAVVELLADELHKDDKDPALTIAPEIRRQMFPGEENSFNDDENPNLDEDRATVRAEAILRHKAREFMSITATTIGLPLLRPGRHVEIRGFRPPFDGFYYVEQTVHSFSEDGLRTKLTARRPGMPLPSTYKDL